MKRLLMISMSSVLLLSSALIQAADTDSSTTTTSPGMTSPGSSSSTMTSPSTTTSPSTGSTSEMTTTTTTTLEGVPLNELTTTVTGWSAKKNILGKEVVNDKDEKVGVIDDIIISPDQKMSYAIIGAGGFLCMGKHDVAIKTDYLHTMNDKLVLSGATKDLLKQLPEFKYPEK